VDVIASRFIADLEGTTTMDEVRAVEEKYDDAFEGAYKDNRKAEEASMAARVVEQADKTGGWYELPLRSEELPDYNPPFVRVPKNAFLRWALRGFRFEDFGKTPPEWDNVAPSGWKMSMDDPYHTDWLLGAGIDLDEAYEHKYDWKTKNQNISLGEAAMKAAYNVKGDIVKDWTGVEFSFLARGDTDYVSGTIVHAKPNQKVAAGSIAIVPNAGPDYYITMMSACKPGEHDRQGAIICETGGKLAHLSITGREQKCTVLMVPGALKKYRDGDFLSIDLDSGKITLSLI
jgi:phosphohistidine swiveling domain-containing protein